VGNVREQLEATESALAESEERFRLLIEGTRDYAIFMLDTSGRIMSWNAGAERINGYSHAEIIGQHFSILYPEEERAAGKPTRELGIATADGKYEEDGWRVRKDGSRYWASVVITPLYGGDGVLTGFGKITRDLTERRAAEEERRRGEQVHRLMVDRVKDYAIFMLDTGGHVMTWNAGAERIKGYRAHEIVGRHFSTFYPEEDKAAGKPARELEIAIATGKYEEEGWRLRKDGSLFWASVVITALRDETGRLRGFGKVTRDLTERRQFEESLREKNAELERALLSKDRFLASMSHELRTPLNAIIGYTGTLLMRLPGPLNPEQEKQLRTVQGGARHLLSLINDLLDLAKINSGTIEIRREPVAVREVVEEVVTTLRPLASDKGIELSTSLPPEDIVIATDRRSLSQILLNLCNNACKFTREGSVRLHVERGEDPSRALIFRVSDTGIGIRPEDQARLFQPFVQVGRDEGGDRNGSGLGLHLSQRLAELLGGRITVESEYGRGSRFTLTLGEG
jgi:PAS domain S-box-containing protein